MTEATFETHARRAWPSLTENKPLRFAVVMILYFMQGVPIGLSLVVLPSWFAAAGAGPAEIGAFVAFALLPWSLKPFTGLIMDRFTYRPMGRRRVWILLAQVCMVAVLAALAIAAPTVDQIALFGSFCFALNLCAIFNDVAVDGMTIDLVPADERGAINGCMYGSQIVGVSITSFAAGAVLSSHGIAVAASLLAVLVMLPSTAVSLFRERPGERLMPWTCGRPSAECEALQQDAWRPILSEVFRSVADRKVIVFLAAFALSSATGALTDTIAPTATVQILGWSSERYSHFAGSVTLVAGVLGITLTGLLIKSFGLARLVTMVGVLLVVLALAGGITRDNWVDSGVLPVILAAQLIGMTILSILLIAWAMLLCRPAVAASQFALMMAVSNFARSGMSGAWGQLTESHGYAAVFYAVAVLTSGMVLLCLYARSRISEQQKDLQRADRDNERAATTRLPVA
ncbi:MAG: MFS transporter [Xanthomonadales bacterium]|nr:MFS transporter [Xanthomonadales bacterium]